MVVALIATTPTAGIAVGIGLAVAMVTVAIWAHLPDRCHDTLPIRAEHPAASLHRPWHYRERAERDGPVFATSRGTRHVVFVGDLEIGAQVLTDHRDELVGVPDPFDELIPRHFIRYMEPEDHRRYRRMLAAAFSPNTMTELEPLLGDASRSWMEVLSARLPGSAPGVEPEPALRPLVLLTWYRVIFGFAPNDDEWSTIERCYDVVDSRHEVSGRPVDHAALAELEALVDGHLRAAELPASAFAVLRERDPSACDDVTLVRNLIFLAWTTSADTTGLLVWVLKRLADNPDWLERVRHAPDGPAAAELADRIVHETLRLGQSEALIRKVTGPITIGEHTVPCGWHLRVGLREAHRDAAVFDDPDRFDPDRFDGHRYRRAEYAPFGLDHHQCIGESLVRATARQFVLAMANGYRCSGRGGGPDEVSTWRHWHPNSSWRVLIEPLDSTNVTGAAASSR